MIEHVRVHVFKRGAYLWSDNLQMLDGDPIENSVLEMDKIGRGNRCKYYENYLESGKPDEKCLTKLPMP